MKICIISPGAYPLLKDIKTVRSAGGAEIQFTKLGVALAERGYNVHFLVGDYGQPDVEKYRGLTIHKVVLHYQGGSNLFLPLDWLKLFITLWSISAKIHLLKVPKDLLLPVSLFCRFVRKRLVYVGQSDKDVDFSVLYSIQNKIAVLMYRLGLAFTDYAVAQNSVQLKGFERLGLKSQIIHNMITLSSEKGEKKGYILWVGNSTENKQPELFIEVAKTLPQYDFKMILAPSGDADNNRFTELASNIENLEYKGFVPFSEIGGYFQEASILVNTSLREGFPNTFLQSWQCGTPVVSLKVDPDRVIERFGIGRLSGTLDQMVRDIHDIMKAPNVRNQMGDSGREYVERNHSVSFAVSEYMKLFHELAGEGKR